MVNRYAETCYKCGGLVPANGGHVENKGSRWVVRHLACKDGPSVRTIRFSTGATMTQNVRGRCEDAPCCGCCT